jgi:hypothetical protein
MAARAIIIVYFLSAAAAQVKNQASSPVSISVNLAGLVLTLSQAEEVVMPNLVGKSLKEATAILQEARLKPGRIQRKSAAAPPDQVLEQSAKAGIRIPVNSTIDLVIAEVEAIMVPNLKGKSREEAVELLARAHLRLGSVRVATRGRETAGEVLSQSPPPGTRLPANDTVSVVVSGSPSPAPRPSPAPPPPPIGNPSFNTVMDEELQRAWRELRDGQIAYEPIRMMTEGQPEEVRARIAQGDTINVQTGFRDRVTVEQMKVSGSMAAELLGNPGDFAIESLSSKSQALVGPFTDWVWRVTPLHSGQLALKLKITAHIRLSNGSSEDHDLLVKDTNITVHANRGWRLARFWRQNWQWILGSPIVLGIGGWIVARIRSKKSTQSRHTKRRR